MARWYKVSIGKAILDGEHAGVEESSHFMSIEARSAEQAESLAEDILADDWTVVGDALLEGADQGDEPAERELEPA